MEQEGFIIKQHKRDNLEVFNPRRCSFRVHGLGFRGLFKGKITCKRNQLWHVQNASEAIWRFSKVLWVI